MIGRIGCAMTGAVTLALTLPLFTPRAPGQARQGSQRAAVGLISGFVMTDGTPPLPARRATITLIRDSTVPLASAVADDTGQFTFTNVPSGRYSLTAEKGGYLTTAYGSKRLAGSGTPIVLSEGQQIVDLAMTIRRGSVIAGTVLDEHGRPATDVMVAVLEYAPSRVNAERVLQVSAAGRGALTDDRGAYRIYGLPPGDYLVSATASLPMTDARMGLAEVREVSEADIRRALQYVRSAAAIAPARPESQGGRADSPIVTYAPVYHPSATSPTDASIVTLKSGEERTGVDLLLRLVRPATIRGTASGLDGRPLPGVSVTIMDPGPQPVNSVFQVLRSAASDREGGFVLPGINPGRYTIYAKATPPGGTPLWGISHVELNGHDVTSPIVLGPGVTFSGRIVFQGSLPRPSDVAAIMPVLSETRTSPLMTGLGRRTASADGTFSYTVAPGTYRLGSTLWSSAQTTGWRLKSLVVNGTDISDVIFDIRENSSITDAVMTFTDRPTQLSGALLDSAGRPSAEYDLIVFAANRGAWLPATRRTRHVRPDVDGRFVIDGLPAGDYFLCALTDVEQGQWDDPRFLAELAATAPMRFTIGDGETKSLSIQAGRR